MKARPSWTLRLFLASCLVWVASPALPAGAQTITLWSHGADEPSLVAWVETAARSLEKKNPGVTVKLTWYQKQPLYTALQTSLSAGKGPDVFYLEPDQTQYVENQLLAPLDDLVRWSSVETWAREVWTFNGKSYAVPVEAYTVELYYNKQLMKKIGVELPANGQLKQADFLAAVKKAAAMGITPIVQGVGDRPYPGAYILEESLLKKLGRANYGKLLSGQLAYKDPRVIEVFQYVKQLVDAGAYPKSFTTLKLGESHYYFHTNPQGLTFPMGSFYTGRAFTTPDKGGQPTEFPLGIMSYPAMDGGACNQCKTIAVGGSYVVNAKSPNPKLAAALLNEMATVEMGNLWLNTRLAQTGIKTDPSKISGPYREYFQELEARNKGAEYFVGIPLDHLKGQCLESFKQVMNTAFPAGLMTVEQAVSTMDRGCVKS
jgi:multiple sugar transport system substrate-binding protein